MGTNVNKGEALLGCANARKGGCCIRTVIERVRMVVEYGDI
jgi:hypothetical protein